MVTGKLDNWEVVVMGEGWYWIWGDVSGDTRGRFPDGTHIHTSQILNSDHDPELLAEGAVVKTRYSSYLLGKPQCEKCLGSGIEAEEFYCSCVKGLQRFESDRVKRSKEIEC